MPAPEWLPRMPARANRRVTGAGELGGAQAVAFAAAYRQPGKEQTVALRAVAAGCCHHAWPWHASCALSNAGRQKADTENVVERVRPAAACGGWGSQRGLRAGCRDNLGVPVYVGSTMTMEQPACSWACKQSVLHGPHDSSAYPRHMLISRRHMTLVLQRCVAQGVCARKECVARGQAGTTAHDGCPRRGSRAWPGGRPPPG